jgi:uncharacterized repeat protein (TIGR03803 family)
MGSLTVANGALYGMTGFGGTKNKGSIFCYNLATATYTDMHDFGTGKDGAYPFGLACSLTLSGNVLYGVTSQGGANDVGCLFAINTNGSGYSDLVNFGGSNNTGDSPVGTLTLSGNILYGVTKYGGTGNGNVFAYTIGDGYKDMHDFIGNEGTDLVGNLVLTDGVLYGMTSKGGGASLSSTATSDEGNIFSININSGEFTDLFDFTGKNGNMGGVLTLSGSTLYGLTFDGGTAGKHIQTGTGGVLFSYNINNTDVKVARN